jgi:hypothetical protein
MSEVAAACDFQASFMTWDRPRAANPPPGDRGYDPLGNKARIQLDALLDVVHEDTGGSERFVLIAPCRSEWMYVPDRIFKLPSEEYRCIYSRTEARKGSRIDARVGRIDMRTQADLRSARRTSTPR